MSGTQIALRDRSADGRRWRAEVMADPVRAARWRAQKLQWWREHRAKRPVQVRVAP